MTSAIPMHCFVNKSTVIYKIVINIVLDYLSLHFFFRSDTLTCNLRDSDCTLAMPKPRTSYCKRSMSYSGAVLRIFDSRAHKFKSKLKNYDFNSILM